jgi:hypothetical protein
MHRWRFLLAVFVVLLFGQFEAKGEGNCPPGQYPIGGGDAGWSGCAPMGQGGGDGGSSDFGGVWEKRWGAIAIDDKAGKYGAADGARSKGAARKSAIADCKKWGGVKCTIWLSYYNQCGVMATGDSFSSTARGPTIEVATEIAMTECTKKDPTCKPYHAGCSYAQRVR